MPDFAPGFHPNIPASVYHAAPGASNSRLNDMEPPARCKWNMDHPPEPTPALIIGSAFHCLVLEGEDVFRSQFATATACNAMQKNGKSCESQGKILIGGRWFCGKHANESDHDSSLTVLSRDDYDLCRRMRDAVMNHSVAGGIIEASLPADRELSAWWDCRETGVRCKMRADMVIRPQKIIVDLKTTDGDGGAFASDASREAFARFMYDYGGCHQAIHYLDGFETLGDPMDWFAWIVPEKKPPHMLAVYRLDSLSSHGKEVIERIRDLRLSRLQMWKKCMESGVWPGYPEEIQDVTLNEWAVKKLERIG